MYTFTPDQVWEEYAAHLEGNKFGAVGVISHAALDEPARAAIAKSCESFGYGPDACVFVTICAEADDCLSATQILSVIEGIDPARLIIADQAALDLCAQGYHRPLKPNEFFTLLQRPTVAFKSFSAAIEKEASKQRAWKLLKRLLRND